MKTRSSIRRSRRGISSLLLDQLESRMLLSSNITASVSSSGVLSLQGNNSSQSIIVDQLSLSGNQFRVAAGDGTTTINGKTGPVIFSGVSGLSISLGCGNDTLVIQNAAVANNVQVAGASGNQVITLSSVTIGGNFSLTNSGGQNSTTLLDSTIDGSVTLNAGTGFNSQCGYCWGGSTFSHANQAFTLSGSTIVQNVSISNVSGETSTDLESSSVGNNLTVTNGASSYGGCDYNYGFKCGSSDSSLAGDLFTMNGSTVGNNLAISNASDGNATTIAGGSTVGGNLTVANTVGTSNQSCFNSSCSGNLANASDAFTLSEFSSVNGNLSIANISDGATAVIDASFVGGGVTINNGVGSYGQGFTSCRGQVSSNFGDYFTLSGGSFVGSSICLANGSTYNSTDIEFSSVGGSVAVSNGLNLNGTSDNNCCGGCSGGRNSCSSNSVYTTDLFTLNGGFIGGSLAVSNASGFTSTSIEGSFITNNASFTNSTGVTYFTMDNTIIGFNLSFTAGAGSATVDITATTVGNNATISVSKGATIVIDPSQVDGSLSIKI